MNTGRMRHLLRNKMDVLLIYLFLLAFVCFSAFTDEKFLSPSNLRNLTVTVFPNLLVAIAQTLVIVTGGIDLSVGSVLALANVICAAVMSNSSAGACGAVICALFSGASIGFASGLVVVKTRIQPLIVTLATSTIAAGAALAVLPKPGGMMHAGFASFIGGRIFGMPTAFWLSILFVASAWLLLNRTRFGQGLLAIGGSEQSAYSSGIGVARGKIVAYILSGLLSAVAGVFLATQMYSGDPTVGDSYTLRSVTICALGGISLLGGRASVVGLVAGAFIMVIINNILNLAMISTFYQFIIQGGILVGALMLGTLWSRRERS